MCRAGQLVEHQMQKFYLTFTETRNNVLTYKMTNHRNEKQCPCDNFPFIFEWKIKQVMNMITLNRPCREFMKRTLCQRKLLMLFHLWRCKLTLVYNCLHLLGTCITNMGQLDIQTWMDIQNKATTASEKWYALWKYK